MKKVVLFSIILLINCFSFYSCKKSDDTSTSSSVSAITLTLDPVKKKYIASSGNGFYSGTFAKATDIQTFSIHVESGHQYVIHGDFPLATNSRLKIIVLNPNMDTLAKGNSYQPLLLFSANSTGLIYLKISLSTTVNSDFNYRLFVEENYVSTLTWQGVQWKTSGDWSVNSDGSLTYVGEGIGICRWIMLNNDTLQHYNASFQFKSITTATVGVNQKGMIINASNLIQNTAAYNLPLYGDMVAIDNTGRYLVRQYTSNGWTGTVGTASGSSWSFSSSSWATFNTTTSGNQRLFSINGTTISNGFNNIQVKPGNIFIVITDDYPETVSIKNFSF